MEILGRCQEYLGGFTSSDLDLSRVKGKKGDDDGGELVL